MSADPNTSDEATRDDATHDEEGRVTEPPNGTVDDWLGQQVEEDERRADELLDETGGDADEAERRFEQESRDDRRGYLPTEERRT